MTANSLSEMLDDGSFDAGAEGVCKRDGRICDLLMEKGERYMREYE